MTTDFTWSDADLALFANNNGKFLRFDENLVLHIAVWIYIDINVYDTY
jgi:hypothetical protein